MGLGPHRLMSRLLELPLDLSVRRFWVLIILLTLFRLLFIGRIELSPDEAYYWTWSRHLDWSYYDQGPMLALVIRLGTWLAGTSETGVRIGSVLLSVISSWFFFDLVRRACKSARAAWYGVLALQTALLFAVGSVLMMHDSIMISCWVAALWSFYRACLEKWPWGWVWGALALGVGALSKYTIALFVPALLLFLVLSPRQRRWWTHPPLYLAGLGAALLSLPVWLWNSAHGWVSFGHVGALAGFREALRLSWPTFFEFLGGQLAVLTPILSAFAWAAPVVAWSHWRRDPADGEPGLFLACFSAPILAFFLLLSLTTEVYANWPAPAYPAALALAAGWLERRRSGAKGRAALNWARAGLVLGGVLTLSVHLAAVGAFFTLPDRWESSLDRVRGWNDLGAEAGRRLSDRSSGPGTPVLGARRYQIAALLSFYTPGRPEVQLLPEHPPAGNQYRFWDRSAELQGRNLLFVCEDRWEAEHLRGLFLEVTPLPSYPQYRGGRRMREILFYRCHHYLPSDAMTVADRGPGRPLP